MKSRDSFGLNPLVIEQINSIFEKVSKIDQVVIYGSRARGNYKTASDIDLTIVGPDLGATDLLKIENDLDDLLLPYKIDLSLLHQIENHDLLDHIKGVGQLFYSRKSKANP